MAGKTGNALMIPGIKLTDSGNQYRCVVSNAEGDRISDVATLTVTPKKPSNPSGGTCGTILMSGNIPYFIMLAVACAFIFVPIKKREN